MERTEGDRQKESELPISSLIPGTGERIVLIQGNFHHSGTTATVHCDATYVIENNRCISSPNSIQVDEIHGIYYPCYYAPLN